MGAALKRYALLGLAGLGFVLSLVLELLHARAYGAPSASSFCSLGARLDCTTVALSRYSVLFGLPVALWGALGFAALALAAWRRSAWAVPFAACAALASLVLLGVELFGIGAFCLLCEAVHVVAVASLFVAWRERASLSPRRRDDAAFIGLPVVGTTLALFFFLPPYWRSVGFRGDLPFSEGVTDDGAHWIGAKNPSLTVDEFTDYLCPHCRAATAWTLKRLAARPSQIRIVRRQFPLSPCRADIAESCVQLRMAYCAAEQGHFWHMDRWLFAHAAQPRPDVTIAARDLGIDAKELARCVARPAIAERAAAESKAASKRRFVGTPTYMVGNKRIEPEVVDRFLAQGHADTL